MDSSKSDGTALLRQMSWPEVFYCKPRETGRVEGYVRRSRNVQVAGLELLRLEWELCEHNLIVQ